jgi:GMP reductase
MATLLKNKAIWFNDVILVPQMGAVRSRKEVPRELNRFICSPMTAVVGPTFAKEATNLGLTVCIPRFWGIKKEIDVYANCSNKDNLYLSMGLNDAQRIEEFSRIGCKNYLVDIADGYLPHIEDTVKFLAKKTEINNLILGNITTLSGFHHLSAIINKYSKRGITRLGLSNGSGCQTYDQTGFGSGQLSEILEIAPYKEELNRSLYEENYVLGNNWIKLASDGGLKNGGYIAKAFLAGADYVMIGGIFAKSLEAEAHVSGDGTYFGLASDKNQILSSGVKTRHSEGVTYKIDENELKPLKDIVEELWGCISSSVSYSGFKTLKEAIGNGVFQIKQNSLPPRKRINPIS